MVTRTAPRHRLAAVDKQEPDRAWFAQRPTRTHRLRALNAFEINMYRKKKPTHVVVVRQPNDRLAKTPVNLTGFDRVYVQTMNEIADYGVYPVLDFELSYLADKAAC